MSIESTCPPAAPRFYVVSIPKFILMASLTLGIYTGYWYYKQWLLYRGQQGFKLVPLLCALCGPFLLYPLMKRVQTDSQDSGAAPSSSPWRVTLMFWLPFAALTSAMLVLPLVPGGIPAETDAWLALLLESMCLTLPMVALVQIQQAINIREGDQLGSGNSQLVWANRAWVVGSWLGYAALMHAFHYLINNGI